MKKILTIFLVLGLSSAATASVTFYVAPNPYPGYDPTLDVPWQTAAGSFEEFDFDNYAAGSYLDNFTTSTGNVVDVGLSNGTTATAAEIFAGSWGGTANGSVYGTVFGNALLNRDAAGNVYHSMVFSFSEPVKGVGAWLFDNSAATAESFRMYALETDGTWSGSPWLESGNGTGHFVEGFLGATSDKGIDQVVYRVFDSDTHEAVDRYFELDHLQIVPTPSAILLGGLGIGIVGWLRRKRSL